MLTHGADNSAVGMAGDNSSDGEDIDCDDDIVKDDNYESEGTHSIDDGSIVIVDFPHHARLLFSRETLHQYPHHEQV